jgi:hypothetical protein
MKKPTRKPKHRRKPVNLLVAALGRFAELPPSEQKLLLEDLTADRKSDGTMQEVRDDLALAIDECGGDGGLDAQYVLWGYSDEE